MLSIGRTTKLSTEPTVKAEKETTAEQPKSPRLMEAELHGGEANQPAEPEVLSVSNLATSSPLTC
jgi:hypothetical protein